MRMSHWLNQLALRLGRGLSRMESRTGRRRQRVCQTTCVSEWLALVIDPLEDRCLPSAAHDIVGWTALMADPTYNSIDGQLDNGQKIGVAVIDSGVFAAHADLRDNFLYYVDAINGTGSNNVNDARDPEGHGTHVSGTILGGFSVQAGDTIGMAPEAGLVGIRVFPGQGERQPQYDPVQYGLEWVLRNHVAFNIKVVNMSLGFNTNYNSLPEADNEARVIDALEREGVTVVVSSGNRFGEYNTLGQSNPATFATLSVANTIASNLDHEVNGGMEYESYWGFDVSPTADTLSPTSQRSTMSNQVAAPGTEILSTFNNGAYQVMNGTSMASPLVAGMVALMQDAAMTFGGRYLTTDEVHTIARDTADIIMDNPDPDTYRIFVDAQGQLVLPRLPNGQVDVSQLQDLIETGQAFRRVNVQHAVQAVRTLVTTGGGGGGGGGGGTGVDNNNTLSSAVALPPLNGTAAFNFQGRIGQDGQVQVGDNDVDLFKLVLETPGSLNILTGPVTGGQSFDAYLRLFDSSGTQLAFDDDTNGTYPGLQTATFPAGTYYLGLSSYNNSSYNVVNGSGSQSGASSGDYIVSVTTTNPDPNGVFQGAAPIDLTSPNYVWPADSQAAQAGIFVANFFSSEINSDPHPLHDDDPTRFPERLQIGPTDVDMFRMVAPDTGRLFIDVNSVDVYGAAAVDSYVVAYRLENNGSLTVVGFNDDDAVNSDSFLALDVEIGKTYFVALTTYGNRNFDPSNPNNRSSTTNQVGLMDVYFSFFNGDVNGTAFADVSLNDTQFDPDGDGLGTFPGSIGAENGVPLLGANNGFKDVDFLKYTATQAGPLHVTVTSPDGSLAPVLGIWQLNNDQSDIIQIQQTGGVAPEIVLNLAAGETIWISITGAGNEDFNWAAPASGSGGDTGNFLLTTQAVTQSQFLGFSNNTVNLNVPTVLTAGQVVSETIGSDGIVPIGNTDVDLFSFVPSTTGMFTIQTNSSSQEGGADTFLRVFNQSGQELAFNDNATSFTAASFVQVVLTAGQTYYIGVNGAPQSQIKPAYNPLTGAGAAAGSTGSYQLLVTAPVAVAPSVTLGVSPSSFAEGAGTATVTATLSATWTSNVTVSLGFSGTATNTSDYTRSNTQIVIPAGSLTGTITLTAAQDTLDENNETVIVDIVSVTNGTESGSQQVTATIVDDDAPPSVTLGLAPSSIAEALGAATVTATLSTLSSFDVTISLGFTGTATNSSDYTRSNTQIVIPAGSLTGTITLTAVQDTSVESNETVIVDITSVTNGTESGTQQVTATILDDDIVPTVTLGVSPASFAEASGTATVTATLSAIASQSVTVNLGFTGTATNNSDYTRSNTQIVIPAGNLTGTITLTAVQDTSVESNETVIVDITSVTNGTESGTQQVVATILDDDIVPTVTLGVSPASIAEASGTATVTATLSAIASQGVTVNLGFTGTATNNSDYTRSNTQIVIPAGSLTGTITLTAVQDTSVESNETVIVDITSVTNGTESGTQQVVATILDDDIVPTVTLGVSPASFAEASGTATVTATLSAIASQSVTVNLGFTGTATNNSDYTRSNTQIVIPAGSLTGTITLTAVQDTSVESNETVIVDITSVTNGTETGTQQVIATILDDEAPPTVTLGVSPASFTEAVGTATVTATLSNISTFDVTVNLTFSGTATNASDYTRSSTQVVISAGSLTGTMTLTSIQDSVIEANETVTVDISSVTNGTESGTQQVTATILDDEAPPTVTLSIAPNSLAEGGGSATITALLSAISVSDVTVSLGFTGTATTGTDYTRSGSQIIITAGSLTGTVTLTALQDQEFETAESIVVDMTSVTNGLESGIQQVTAQIVDDDHAPVFTSNGLPNVSENSTSVLTLVATDADSQPLTYSLSGGADQNAFNLTSNGILTFKVAPDFEAPADNGADNIYEVQVKANDGHGGVATQNISIMVTAVNDNSPVVITPATMTIAENSAAVGTLAATDADFPTQSVTFAITGGVDAGRFLITSGGALTFATPPDFEQPGDFGANNVYDLQVTADDGNGRTTVQNLSITVTPTNDNLPVFTSPAAISIAENSSSVGAFAATDGDLPAQTLTYTISGGADAARFEITSDGILTFAAPPNFESPSDVGTNNVYNVQVTARDGNGGVTVQNVAVTVTPMNDNSPLFITPQTFGVTENATSVGTLGATDADLPAQTITFSISGGPDAARFLLSSTGALTFVAAPDFDNPADVGANNVYNIQVTASDGNGGLTVQNLSITVAGTNDNLPMFVSSSVFNIPENSTTVGAVIAADSDLPSQTMTYSISGGPDAGRFILTSEGVLAFANPPDFETPADTGVNNVYNLRITASDGNGGLATQDLVINVTALNDNLPAFTSPATYSVPENTTIVGAALATDADLPVQGVTFTITGGLDAGLFQITSSGILSFISAPDFERPTDVGTNNVYDLQITATDGTGGSTARNLTVTVTSVSESPIVHLETSDVTWINHQPATMVLQQTIVDGPNLDAAGTLTITMDAVGTKKKALDALGIPSFSSLGTSASGLQYANGQLRLQISLKPNTSAASIQAFLHGITFMTKGKGLNNPSRVLNVELQGSGTPPSSLSQTIRIRKK